MASALTVWRLSVFQRRQAWCHFEVVAFDQKLNVLWMETGPLLGVCLSNCRFRLQSNFNGHCLYIIFSGKSTLHTYNEIYIWTYIIFTNHLYLNYTKNQAIFEYYVYWAKCLNSTYIRFNSLYSPLARAWTRHSAYSTGPAFTLNAAPVL